MDLRQVAGGESGLFHPRGNLRFVFLHDAATIESLQCLLGQNTVVRPGTALR